MKSSKSKSDVRSKPVLLTKSKYIHGINCSKYIWLEFNAPERLPEFDESSKARMQGGIDIGKMAQKLFPEGVYAGVDENEENDDDSEEGKRESWFTRSLRKSEKLARERKTMFEAGFIFGKCYARADIMVPVGKNEWDLFEVKSGCSVKSENFEDVAFQKWCYEGAGLKIRKSFIIHLNNQYIKEGELDLKELFVIMDITEEINELVPLVPEKVDKIFDIISLKKCPEHEPGKYYCDDKYGCHHDDKFWKEHPTCDILDIHRMKAEAIELFHQGVLEIAKIPDECKLGPNQEIQKKCHRNKEAYKEVKSIKSFLDRLVYPLYFMDFETYGSGIPKLDGTRPYQPIPFQFSVHVIESPEKMKEMKRYSFIAEPGGDSRKEFIEELKKAIGAKGSIIVYFESFEKSRLDELAEVFPEYAKWVESAKKRFVDLYAPFNKFAYYHPKQEGSTSLKYVLPALTGRTYEDLEIQEGQDASNRYARLVEAADAGALDKTEMKETLEYLDDYCSLDTEGMVLILEKLREAIGE